MATDFLLDAGTNGFKATPFNLLSTELNTLASAANIISSVGGTSGVFTQTNFVNCIWGQIYFVAGGALGGTPAAGAYIAGWFIFSPDGGTAFEKANYSSIDMPRSPDFVIPLNAIATAASDIYLASGLVRLPWNACKVYIGNRTGQALTASGNLIKCAPVAIQY